MTPLAATPRYSWIWIGYTILYFGVVLTCYLTPYPERTLCDFIDIPVTLIAALGLACFVFNRQLLPQLFWKCYAPLFIVWDIFYNIWITAILRQGQRWNQVTLPEILIAFGFVLPLYAALLQLGYKRRAGGLIAGHTLR